MNKKEIMTYANRIARELLGNRQAALSYVLKKLHKIVKERNTILSYYEIRLMVITGCTPHEACNMNRYCGEHAVENILDLKKYPKNFEYNGRHVIKYDGFLYVSGPNQSYTCVCLRDIDRIQLNCKIADSFITDSDIFSNVEVSTVVKSLINKDVYNCYVYKSEINDSICNSLVYKNEGSEII